MGVAAGCGGGGQEQGSGKQKSASGVVKASEVDRNKLRLKPEGEKPQIFKYNPKNIDVTLEGEDAKLADIKEDQKATISYVVKDDRQLARSLELEKK